MCVQGRTFPSRRRRIARPCCRIGHVPGFSHGRFSGTLFAEQQRNLGYPTPQAPGCCQA